MKKNIPYGRHHITEEDIQEVVRVLQSDFLTQGPVIPAFEKELASKLGAKHVVAVSNGTTALHLAAAVLGVTPGDRVLCTPNTFVASANCIRYCGGEIDFVDIDEKNFCIDLEKVEETLKKNPRLYKGVVAVDFAGFALDFEGLHSIARRHGLWIIEDACHALGARFLNSEKQWVTSGNGRYADISVFSFHPVKHVAMGEGGALSTNDDRLAARLRLLRTHGITKDSAQVAHPEQGWYMEMRELGFNYRLPDMNAALGLSQLRRLDENLRRRQEIAGLYDKAFASRGWVFPHDRSRVFHAYHLYVLQVPDRLGLYNHLREKGIYAQVHYVPVTDHPYYRERYGKQTPSKAAHYYERALSLPMYPGLKNEDVQFVIDSILEFHERR